MKQDVSQIQKMTIETAIDMFDAGILSKENLKKISYRIYYKALRNKEIERLYKCENCFSETRIEGHHPDYKKPLNVVWLCDDCHAKVHFLSNYISRIFGFDFWSKTHSEINEENKLKLYDKLNIKQKYIQLIKEKQEYDLKMQLFKEKTNELLNKIISFINTEMKTYSTGHLRSAILELYYIGLNLKEE